MDLLFDDIGYIDLTTSGLEISDRDGVMNFSAKENLTLSGCGEVEKLLRKRDVIYNFYREDGESLKSGDRILKVIGKAGELHKLWKVSQNLFEYMSGVATTTREMVNKARNINSQIVVATTRKHIPSAKELMINSVLHGGGTIHRLGLYDSILIFQQHRNFISEDELSERFRALKLKFIEKKIIVEVEAIKEGELFASLGADVLQCEKMSFENLKECVKLKERFPNILLSATGGINLKNIEEFVNTGVDFIVTSSPYHSKPVDIKVEIEAV